MADRGGSDTKPETHDPLKDSLDELNRIADELVDGLALEGDRPEAGSSAAPEEAPAPDCATDGTPDPPGTEVADLFAHVDALLAPQLEPEAAPELAADDVAAAQGSDQADPPEDETIGIDTIELDAEDLEAAEAFVGTLEAPPPKFDAPADANIDLPPLPESAARGTQPTDARAEESLPDEPVADFQDEPVADLQDEPVADFQDEPVADLQDEPVADFQDEPVADFQDEPVADFQDEPVADLQDEPVETEHESAPETGGIPWPPETAGMTESMDDDDDELAMATSVAAAAQPVFETPTPRPSRAPWMIAAVFIVVAVAVAAWWLLSQPSEPAGEPSTISTAARTAPRATQPPPAPPALPDALVAEPAIGEPMADSTVEPERSTATVPPSPRGDESNATFNAASGGAPVPTPRSKPAAPVGKRKAPAPPQPIRAVEAPKPRPSTGNLAAPTTRSRRTNEQVQRAFDKLSSGGSARGSESTEDAGAQASAQDTVDAPPVATVKSDDAVTQASTEAPPATRSSATLQAGPAGPSGPDAVETQTIPETPEIPTFRPAEVLERVEPTYPPRSQKRGEGGTVVLKVLVDEDGNVARVVVEQGLDGSELEAAAIGAVLRWRYRPATENGHTIRGWTTETFVFDPAE